MDPACLFNVVTLLTKIKFKQMKEEELDCKASLLEYAIERTSKNK